MKHKRHRPGPVAILGKGHGHRLKNRPTRQQHRNQLRKELHKARKDAGFCFVQRQSVSGFYPDSQPSNSITPL